MEKDEKKKIEEKKYDEITIDNFNSGKCSYADVTRGTTGPNCESRQTFSTKDKEFLSVLIDLPTNVDITRVWRFLLMN